MNPASFLSRLSDLLDCRGLVTAPDDMAPHLVDWRRMFHGEALAVVRPRTAQEVAGVVAACAQAGV
ncbi:MAG: FAD-binding oxidoreductase, partial [Rhizobiales bacterium]|nr:FAD-binding oxidoreductase [Hyphomicrobiales bacterium]